MVQRMSRTSQVRGRATAVLLGATLALSACGAGGTTPDAPSATSTPSGDELPPGFDEMPDGEITPDSALSPAEITALLRLPASGTATSDSCRPDEVTTSIEGLDAAAGHRYARVVLTNVSSRTCTVSGFPGIGARGEWGTTFELAAEHRDPSASPVAPSLVTLQPGGAGFANLEWTGELAGAESEKISMLVLQLAQGQDAFGVRGVGEVAGDSGDLSGQPMPLDIGILTTVRIGPVQAMAP